MLISPPVGQGPVSILNSPCFHARGNRLVPQPDECFGPTDSKDFLCYICPQHSKRTYNQHDASFRVGRSMKGYNVSHTEPVADHKDSTKVNDLPLLKPSGGKGVRRPFIEETTDSSLSSRQWPRHKSDVSLDYPLGVRLPTVSFSSLSMKCQNMFRKGEYYL